MRLPLLGLCASLLTLQASALITVGTGNAPVTDQNWPAGALDVANLKTRVGWFEGPPFGGGQWRFQYRGDQAAFADALERFGRINAPALRVVLHECPGTSQFLKGDKDKPADASVDWEFTVWNPMSFHHLYNNPQSVFSAEQPEFRGEVDPPRLDVYVTAGRLDWSRVTPPASVTVTDDRATSHGFTAADGNILRGTVYNVTTSKPIPNVEAALERYAPPAEAKPAGQPQYEKVITAVTDNDGRFEIKQTPAGGYRLVLRRAGYAPRVVSWVSLQKSTFASFTTHLAATAEVAGVAVDTAGKPLAGITIRADNPMSIDGRGYTLPDTSQAVTGADGSFKIAGLPDGHVQLFAHADHYLAVDVLKLYDVPAVNVVVNLTQTGTVKGRVLLPAGGAGKNGLDVNIVPEGGSKVGSWGGSMNAKADGTFQFDGVPPGKYFVSTKPLFGNPAKEPKARAVVVKPGETVEVDIPMP